MASEQLQQIVQMLCARPPGREGMSWECLRAGYEQMAGATAIAEDIERAPARANGVPVEWIAAPEAAKDRAVLYLHGGGYVIGSITTHRDLCARLSRAAGAQVLAVAYRLAPEHVFPAAIDDAVEAYRWLLGQGFEPSHLAIGGDSAGGGLTVATLVSLRDAGVPLPAAAICLSPWVDLEGTGESLLARADIDPIVQKDPLLAMSRTYLGETDPRSPLASPIYADLHGLPPMLIQVGTAETLYDDAIRLAERARAAGIDVTLEPWEDMIHVWQTFAPILPEGQQAIDQLGRFLRAHIASYSAAPAGSS